MALSAQGSPAVTAVPIASDEKQRIELLHALRLLGSSLDPEPEFDRIARLAARTLNAPIALIALLDAGRQCFASSVGTDCSDAVRDIAFCAQVVHDRAPLLVDDTLRDARFAADPLVAGRGMRFCAGAPIFSAAGIALGTLCVIDRAPRTLGADELQTLCDFAALVSHEIAAREARQANLEDRVRARTRQLQQTNERLTAALERQRISERSLIAREALLRDRERQLFAIADNLPVHIAYVDAGLTIRFINAMYRDDLGIAAETAEGRQMDEVAGEKLFALIEPRVKRVLQGEQLTFESDIYLQGCTRTWNSVYIPDVQDGAVRGFYLMSQDITAHKQRESSLEQRASRDDLTGLYNRRALLERLAIATARLPQTGGALALLFLDLDGFKEVNDRYGHEAGDLLLQQFTSRLLRCVRSVDTVARLAGDEFVILLEELQRDSTTAEMIGRKVLESLRVPVFVGGEPHQLGVSIGIHVCGPDDGYSVEQILAAADAAMYRAKRGGKNRLSISGSTDGEAG